MPLPESFAALEAMREALHARTDGKNLRFIEFALRFEARVNSAVSGREAVLRQAQACRHAAWQFDLPAVDELQAYEAAVEIAGALGLVAYDATLGLGFLPDGRVVPTEFARPDGAALGGGSGSVEARPWGWRPPDALQGESEVREVLAPALARAMAGSGFALVSEPREGPGVSVVLVRELGVMRQALSVQLMRYEQLSLTFKVWHASCTAVLAQALGPAPHRDAAFELDLKFFEPGPESQHNWSLDRMARLPAVLALVCGRVLPLAELTRDLHGLDQLLNDASADSIRTPYRNAYPWSGRPDGSDGSRSLLDLTRPLVRRLIVAHLDGHPAASDIDRELEAHWRRSDDWHAPRELEVLAAVRGVLAHTAPLARWTHLAEWQAARRPIPGSLLARAVDPRGWRCHHHEVGEALHQDLCKAPADFWNRFTRANALAEFKQLWDRVADTLPAPERIAPEGLDCQVRTLPGKADAGAISVVCLCFPPITGLDEQRMLALARRGEVWRMFRMGYHFALEDDERMLLRIEYWVRNGNGHSITRETLDAELGIEIFLDRIAQLFD